MKNVFLSVVIIAALAVAGIGGTLAQWQVDPVEGTYNWDAGYLDLKVDIEGIWQVPDAEGHVGSLINVDTIMPGDTGHTTFSLHAEGAPATDHHAILTVTGTADNFEYGVKNPELVAGDDSADGGSNDGELADFLVIKLWFDEGLTPGWQGRDVDPEEGDNIFQHDFETAIYWGTFAELITANTLGPEEIELAICEIIYIGLDWTLADYGVAYGHPWDSFTPSTAAGVVGNVNQCMTDALDGTITMTLSGPFPDPAG